MNQSEGKVYGSLYRAYQRRTAWMLLFTFLVIGALWTVCQPYRPRSAIRIVAFEATRECFQAIDEAYTAAHQLPPEAARTFFAGSAHQARTLARGFVADVVCLASAAELDFVAAHEPRLDPAWRDRFPFGSSPFTSTIVILVRAGNPRAIHDWKDLYRSDVHAALPHPQTSGAGEYAYLALCADVLRRYPDAPETAVARLRGLFARVHLFDDNAQRALLKFRANEKIDAFLTWESEAWRAQEGASEAALEVIYPSRSILAEPVVAVQLSTAGNPPELDPVAYVEFLFSERGQRLVAEAGWRPRRPDVAQAYAARFPALELIPADAVLRPGAHLPFSPFDTGETLESILRFRTARTVGGTE